MICQGCGAEVDDALILCPHCGHDLTESAPEEENETVVPVVKEKVERRASAEVRQPTSSASAHAPAGSSGWIWLLVMALLIGCVALVFLAAGLGGLYQGLKERDLLNQVNSREHYNRGMEHLQTGETELAMAEFEESLRLYPGFKDAYEALKKLRVKSPTVPTPTSQVVRQAVDVILKEAQTQFDSGNWSDAITKLEQLKSLDPAFQPDQVQELLYTAHMKNGAKLLEDKRMEEALRSFEAALAVRPDDTQATEQKTLASLYLTAVGYAGANWEQAIAEFSTLYSSNPDYLDVRDQLYEAHVGYAESLVGSETWCDAVEQYRQAIDLKASDKLQNTLAEIDQKCQANPSAVRATRSPTTTLAAVPTQPPPTKPLAATTAPKPPAVAAQATSAISPTKTITNPVAAPTAATVAAVAPKLSGTLAFSGCDPDQKYRVYAIRLGTGNAEANVLVQDADQPAFSNDGTRLAFHSRRSDLGGIRVADPGGNNAQNITKFGEDGFPSWSPDGTQVVIASTREGDRKWRIFTAWAGSLADSVALTLGQSPSWSVQGPIAYHGCDRSGGNCGIWVMVPNGSNQVPITSHESDTAPAWSPDGLRLAFMSARDGNWEVYTANGDGSQLTRVTNNPANDGLPVWSPDGTGLAFASDRGGSWGLYVIPASGGDAQKVVDAPSIATDWLSQRLSWTK